MYIVENLQDKRVAVYFGTRNLYGKMIPAAKSLMCNSNVEEICLLIEDDDFPYELPPMIKTYNMSQQPWFDSRGPNYCSGWTYMGLLRAAFPKIFPNLDFIVSLDVDTIVDKNISELWDFLMDGYYFAATKEGTMSIRRRQFYTNSGVMLMNLKAMRDNKKDEQFIRALNTKRYTYITQDCFNDLCQGHILELLSDYNACQFTEKTNNKCIIHFAGMRGWDNKDIVQKYAKLSWDEVILKWQSNF